VLIEEGKLPFLLCGENPGEEGGTVRAADFKGRKERKTAPPQRGKRRSSFTIKLIHNPEERRPSETKERGKKSFFFKDFTRKENTSFVGRKKKGDGRGKKEETYSKPTVEIFATMGSVRMGKGRHLQGEGTPSWKIFTSFKER